MVEYRKEKVCSQSKFPIGTTISARDYCKNNPKWTTGTVVKHEGTTIVGIETDEGLYWRRHTDQIRPGAPAVAEQSGGSAVPERQ